jgi:hypothetical protein
MATSSSSKSRFLYHRIKNENEQYNLLTQYEKNDYLMFMANDFDKQLNRTKGANSTFREWFEQDERRVYFENKYKNGFFEKWNKEEIMIYKEVLYSNEFNLQEMDSIDLVVTRAIGRFFGFNGRDSRNTKYLK